MTTDNSDVRLVEKEQADFLLYASNESFDDENVHMTIAVDGVNVVDGDFHVEGQHSWISLPLGFLRATMRSPRRPTPEKA